MKFRPCIDLHKGKVKQIVGSTLTDASVQSTTTQTLKENFSTNRPASEFAELYQRDGLTGGHVIMLGRNPENVQAARQALEAYPGGLQVGGGITPENALEWLEYGASHIIVTSYIFSTTDSNNADVVNLDRSKLQELSSLVGKDRLVLDLSCRKKPSDPSGPYYVVTNRWQTFSTLKVNAETLSELSTYCSEFLIHGVDVEGHQCGILSDLVQLLGQHSPIPATYAGGATSLDDLNQVLELGNGRVDLTIGSALDCFGGKLSYDKVVEWHHSHQNENNDDDGQGK